MPGRPGRSKGCFKCRQRHIKCDETQPSCLRCQKARAACPGYPQTEFIDESSAFWKRNGTPNAHRLIACPITSPGVVLPIKPTSPLAQDVCISFLQDAVGLWDVNQTDVFPAGSWMQWLGFRALQMPNALPRLSLQAFALSFFGRLMNVDSARLAGAQVYGQALSELKANLAWPTAQQRADIVVAITIFKEYEFLTATNSSAWMEHSMGLAALFEAIGPHFFATEQTIQLLEANRHSVLLASILSRKESFLAQQAWKSIPYATNNLPKDDEAEFLDLFADLTIISSHWAQLQEESDAMQHSSKKHELQLEICDAAQRLYGWKSTWDAKHEGDIWDGPPSPDDVNLPHNRSLHFKSASLGVEFLNWSAALLILLEMAEALRMPVILPYLEVHDAVPSTDSDETQVLRMRYEVAGGICSTIPFFLTRLGNMLIRLEIQYPIRMAWRTMRYHDKNMARRLERLAAIVSSSHGWQIGRHLLSDYSHSPQRLITIARQTPEEIYSN